MVRNVGDADICNFSVILFFFAYQHCHLEGSYSNGTKTRHVNLVVACGPEWVMRSDTGLHNLKHLQKGIVDHMMCVRGGLEGVKFRWNGCSSIIALKTSSQFFLHVAFCKAITYFQK
jgi:hypothetical protein